MHQSGIHAAGGDATLVKVGWSMCSEIQSGVWLEEIKALALCRSDRGNGGGGLTPGQADDMVDYATTHLCPQP